MTQNQTENRADPVDDDACTAARDAYEKALVAHCGDATAAAIVSAQAAFKVTHAAYRDARDNARIATSAHAMAVAAYGDAIDYYSSHRNDPRAFWLVRKAEAEMMIAKVDEVEGRKK